MRILIDYRPALRERTGVGEYVHELAASYVALQQARGNGAPRDIVTLFSSSWKDRLEPGRIAYTKVHDRRVPVRLLNFAWNRLEWPPVETLTGEEYDVIHSPHPLLVPVRRGAQVITIHDLDFLDHPERTRGEIRRDYPVLAAQHAQRADQIIVSSRFTAAEVQRRFTVSDDRITLVSPGAPPWSPRGQSPREGYLLFFGTLEPRKNVGALIDAFGSVLHRLPAATDLVLAGAAPPSAGPWLEALRHPPLAGRVRHIGYVPPEAREALYRGARALVMPSLNEGFGLPALEAMTVGVPVIAASRGSLPEVVADAGLFFDPEDPESLAVALERAATDDRWAEAAGLRGIQRARAYTWREAAEALERAYERALHARGRRGE